MVTEIRLFESDCWIVIGFSLCSCRKSDFYQINGHTREELFVGILAADWEA